MSPFLTKYSIESIFAFSHASSENPSFDIRQAFNFITLYLAFCPRCYQRLSENIRTSSCRHWTPVIWFVQVSCLMLNFFFGVQVCSVGVSKSYYNGDLSWFYLCFESCSFRRTFLARRFSRERVEKIFNCCDLFIVVFDYLVDFVFRSAHVFLASYALMNYYQIFQSLDRAIFCTSRFRGRAKSFFFCQMLPGTLASLGECEAS